MTTTLKLLVIGNPDMMGLPTTSERRHADLTLDIRTLKRVKGTGSANPTQGGKLRLEPFQKLLAEANSYDWIFIADSGDIGYRAVDGLSTAQRAKTIVVTTPSRYPGAEGTYRVFAAVRTLLPRDVWPLMQRELTAAATA